MHKNLLFGHYSVKYVQHIKNCYTGNIHLILRQTCDIKYIFFIISVPPRWVMEPGDSFVILKNSVSLDCLTTGSPKPTIQWKKAIGMIEQSDIAWNVCWHISKNSQHITIMISVLPFAYSCYSLTVKCQILKKSFNFAYWLT